MTANREQALKSPDSATRSMVLPEGKICQDCIGFPRCKAFGVTKAENDVCDWYPNGFIEKVKPE